MKPAGESLISDHDVRYCSICRKRFEPHPRLGQNQRTCGDSQCQKERRRINAQDWRSKHPEADDAVYRQIRRRDHGAYRKQYWATHPKARQHHAAYMRQWRARRRKAVLSVRDPYRDIAVKLPAVNTYMQVMDVREANRVITVKLLSAQEMINLTAA
jgi:hypothetical protein